MSRNHSRTVSINTPSHSSRGRTPEGEPNPVDVYVGSRLRLRRTVLNLSQEKLAALAGLTFQQIQKYERGMNRIGASRLYDFAQILEVPVSYFLPKCRKRLRSTARAVTTASSVGTAMCRSCRKTRRTARKFSR